MKERLVPAGLFDFDKRTVTFLTGPEAEALLAAPDPNVLRHSCAMSLLQAGVDTTVIALWLGHAGVRSTDAYVHADMTIKEKALALTAPVAARPGRRQTASVRPQPLQGPQRRRT